MPRLEDISILAWLKQYDLKTENGTPIDLKDHKFMFDIYRDMSPKQAIMKAAQVTATTTHILKVFWVVKKLGFNAIYLLPTEDDIQKMVGSKVNPIIQQNPVLQEYTRDKDTIEQKQIGEHFIHFKGTWSEKAAIMVSSDLNIYDEVDASNQRVIEQYSTRLQHSPYKWEWYFSHPSAEGSGVDKYWQRSDQKHWFVLCHACAKWQYLSWPESIDTVRQCFQCSHCKAEISNETRRKGKWVAKYPGREFSGYWIPLLICPWVSAKEIIGYFNNKSEEYFYNKVLGLPYVGGGNKLTKAQLMANLTTNVITPEKNDRVVIGVDTGKKIHFVCGSDKGLFYYSQSSDYEELETLLKRWPRAIAVIDQGGDLIGSRKLREAYPGRVFLCSYGEDRKTQELVRWGKNDEDGAVIADRNRMLTLLVSEFVDKRVPLQGTENDWYDFYLHWNNLTRIVEENERGQIKKVWMRNGDDHWAHAANYWRVGMMRFGGEVKIMGVGEFKLPESYEIKPNQTVEFNPKTFFKYDGDSDWRKS